jgi:saposin
MLALMVRAMRAKHAIKDTDCDICKTVVGALQSALLSNSTQQDILSEIEKICADVGPLRNVCVSFINEYGSEVLNYLANEFDPVAVCQDIGACPKMLAIDPLVIPPPPKN